jgi:hypothetical protein
MYTSTERVFLVMQANITNEVGKYVYALQTFKISWIDVLLNFNPQL